MKIKTDRGTLKIPANYMIDMIDDFGKHVNVKFASDLVSNERFKYRGRLFITTGMPIFSVGEGVSKVEKLIDSMVGATIKEDLSGKKNPDRRI